MGASAVAFAVCAVIGTAPAICAEKTLYKFKNGSDGATPYAGLISDSAGNLYGTTNIGGTGSCEFGGCGTVYKLAPNGTETVVYSFLDGDDGAEPFGGLIADGGGNLYGTAVIGGASENGTVFRIAPDGSETTLYSFQGGSDGANPGSTLLMDANGDLFGTAGSGGSFNGSDCSAQGCGTVFEVEPDGTKITTYTFQGGSDGWSPTGELIADGSGNLYGTTTEGGNGGATCQLGSSGCGTVFEIAPDGTETQLYAFKGGNNDGYAPRAGLVADSTGNLYGTTEAGGSCSLSSSGCGTVFRLTPDGTETVLYKFKGGKDGAGPFSRLILDKAGNLYGTTYWGGGSKCDRAGCGTVFEITAQGSEKVLYAFQSTHGRSPWAGLLLGPHNELYGTTTQGGTHNNGVVFELKK